MAIRLGAIGAGNMATAVLCGAVASSVLKSGNAGVFDIADAAALALADKCGAKVFPSAGALVEWADVILLAVKPNAVQNAIAGIDFSGKSVISIVAGLHSDALSGQLMGTAVRILRVMPNTPLLVGAGATALAMPCNLQPDELGFAEALFGSLGKTVKIEERYMDAVTGVSGSGPAYVYMFIEAMADAGVQHGLSRGNAQLLAAQTVLGAARMVLETGEHPGALKDAVCSPGGTTIDAVAALEACGLRSAVFRAVDAAVEKCAKL